MILRFLNWQGITGLAASAVLAVLLAVQAVQTRHWKKQSAGFEQLYRQEQDALAATVASVRAATQAARAADQANATRVADEQRAINERTANDFEARLAAARTRAEQLRQPKTPTDPGPRGSASVPGLPVGAGSAAQAAGQDRLPQPDALTATEQAIQLDELIKWIRAQAKVDNNPAAVASPAHD
jgi:hypothetical protein